jgi:hypothetical protein
MTHYDPNRRLYMMSVHDRDLHANNHHSLQLGEGHSRSTRGISPHTAMTATQHTALQALASKN